MAKHGEAPKAETIENVVSIYRKTGSINETALQAEISTTKVRKILITMGLWSSPRSLQIRQLADQGKSSAEIAETLQISVVMVQNYLPYKKGLYDEPKKTDTAMRSEKYRARNRSYAQKSRSREQKRPDGLPEDPTTASPREKKAPYAMLLHLELRDSRLDFLEDDEAKILAKYGGVVKSISRDVIVPSSLALHQLHYLINMAFGWTNSHLHDFKLPHPLLQSLTAGTLLEIAPVFGYYLQFPSSTFDDAFWDDDYEETKSPRTWMRSKYLKQYRYRGISEYWLENQVEIRELARRRSMLTIHSFGSGAKAEPGQVRFEDASFQELLNPFMFDTGMPDVLKESLRLSEILSLDPVDIETAKASALAMDSGGIGLYKRYRDVFVAGAKQAKGSRDESIQSHAFLQMQMLQKKYEPKHVMPITDKLLYRYDYGDGWEVDITLVKEFGKDGRMVDDETAAKVIADRRPVCIAKDGLHVLDDCGHVFGYIDMLEIIHGDDREEARDMREWARGQGWTGRDVSPGQIL